MAATKLIIGLGNPDAQYSETRHNVGFMFLDYLAKKLGANDFSAKSGPASGWEFNKKLNSFILKTKLEKTPAILAKPQTYVNKSGEAVKKLIRNSKFEIRNLVIVHDDLDIPFDNTKISFDRNSGGHKGVESVMKSLKTKKFYRLRIGLGTRALTKARALSDSRRDEFVRNYVLSRFSSSESEKLKAIFKGAYNKLLTITK